MIVVKDILPAIRVLISRELVEKHGLMKSKAASLMGLTPAAITQYLNTSRGDNTTIIEGSKKVAELISDIALDMIHGKSPPDMLLLKMCRICQIVRTEGLMCELHMEALPGLKTVQSCTCSLGLVKSLETIETVPTG
jgi:predicted transcriptional regulator